MGSAWPRPRLRAAHPLPLPDFGFCARLCLRYGLLQSLCPPGEKGDVGLPSYFHSSFALPWLVVFHSSPKHSHVSGFGPRVTLYIRKHMHVNTTWQAGQGLAPGP